ncbi:MAG: hypothetical protein IJ945_02650 [Oscillospiraceae bacterium]|nr:hypothetical protein [Oscillospiraceae bacterium]
MEKNYFYVRYSRQNFEYYAGHGMQKTYEAPETFVPLSEADFGVFLYFNGYIRNEQGAVTGCLFKGYGEPTIHEVYPGKVYSILSSTTTVDDDGCPEEVSIWHYVEIIPCSE